VKIHLTKKGMTRFCQPNELALMQSAGWRESTAKPAEPEQVREEVIRLRPPVKSKATVTAVEAANIKQQGDE
jgi:cytochrome P450